MSVVLDASAIIAMLKGERGATKVAAEIGGARVSSVNYAESSATSSMPAVPEREVNAMLDPLPLTVVPADKALARRSLGGCGWQQPRRAQPWRSFLPGSSHGATVCPHGPATRIGRRSPMLSRSRLSRSADFARSRVRERVGSSARLP